MPEPPTRTRFRFLRLRRRRVRYVALLPTLLTLGNGICGFIAITCASRGMQSAEYHNLFHWAGYFILVAMIFDALDGKVARVTRTATTFGAQLDSLCDLVSFGVAPGFLVYALNAPALSTPQSGFLERILLVVCIFYAMCALVRLARFTVETTPDDKSHEYFSGCPSPAAAGVVASAVIPWNAFPGWPVVNTVWEFMRSALPFIIFFLGILMVSRIRYVHFVNRLFQGMRPFVRLIELGIVALLVVIFHEVAIFLAFAGYVLTGPVLWARNRLLPKPAPTPPPPPQADTEHDHSFF